MTPLQTLLVKILSRQFTGDAATQIKKAETLAATIAAEIHKQNMAVINVSDMIGVQSAYSATLKQIESAGQSLKEWKTVCTAKFIDAAHMEIARNGLFAVVETEGKTEDGEPAISLEFTLPLILQGFGDAQRQRREDALALAAAVPHGQA